MLWTLRHPGRLLSEHKAISDLLTSEPWLSEVNWLHDDGLLAVDATIAAHGHQYEVRLTFPEYFPLVPAFVQPRDPDAYWSGHQYGSGGTLCLELRPDNWHPEATGADVLRSAFHLLEIENPLGGGPAVHAPSAHRPWPTWAVSMTNHVALIYQGTLDRMQQGLSKQPSWSYWYPARSCMSGMICDEVDMAAQLIPPVGQANWVGATVPLSVCCATSPLPEFVESHDQLASLLQLNINGATDKCDNAYLVLSREKAQLVSVKGNGPFAVCTVHVMQDDANVRKADIATEKLLKIGLVGAGSIGSKIAESLVRAGVAELVVIDGDLMLPANLSRHALNWERVGAAKAKGLAEHLGLINLAVKVQAINVDLRWQQSPQNYSDRLKQLTDCHILVDATGDHPTTLMLAAMAEAASLPFIAVSVFEGGIGALLAPCVPGLSPPFVIAYEQYQAYCKQEVDAQGIVIPPPPPRRYEGTAADGSPMMADDADVSMAAAHAARLILDMMARPDDPELAQWLLLGFRNGWLFKRHGDNRMIEMGSYSPPAKVPDDVRNQGLALLIEIIRRKDGVEAPDP